MSGKSKEDKTLIKVKKGGLQESREEDNEKVFILCLFLVVCRREIGKYVRESLPPFDSEIRRRGYYSIIIFVISNYYIEESVLHLYLGFFKWLSK